MTVLIRQSRRYEQVYYDQEQHFQSIAKKQLTKLLPHFAILEFSPFVLGDEGIRRRPDLAIVDRNYGMWVVVEVELESHSLNHHVTPQVQTFATGRYDESHARTLNEADETLELDYLYNLIFYSPPLVAVIVNSRSVLEKGWTALEEEYSARLTFVESYRASDGDVVISVSGFLPIRPPKSIVRLKKHPMLNALVCHQPKNFPSMIDEEMCIYIDDRPYRWEVLRTKDTVVLLVPSGFAARHDRNYEVFEVEDGRYVLRQL